MRRWLLAILLLFIFAAGALAWLHSQGYIARGHETLHLAINKWPSDELLYLAQQKGFFKDAGVDVNLVVLNDITEIRDAIRFNRVDGGTMTLTEVLTMHAAGTPTKIVLLQDFSNGADVIIARAGIANVAGLRARRVGVEKNSLGMLVLAEALAQKGMTLANVTVVPTEQPDMEAALRQKKIDAAVTYPPFAPGILRDRRFNAIFDTTRIPATVIDVLALREEEFRSHKAQIPAVIAAWDQALRYAHENPDEFRALIMQRENMSAEETDAALAGLKILDANEMRRLTERHALTRAIERTKDVLLTPAERAKTWDSREYFEPAPLFGALIFCRTTLRTGGAGCRPRMP
ncbi:MAG: hypothetical protein GC131_06375 [Alphaproteobacteria bacterium]|nr:hypothetical protein [Alphaproteobacteria bacterium]